MYFIAAPPMRCTTMNHDIAMLQPWNCDTTNGARAAPPPPPPLSGARKGTSVAPSSGRCDASTAASSMIVGKMLSRANCMHSDAASQGGWWQGCGAAYSISCVGSVTTRGAASGRRPSEITIGTDADASRGTIL